MYLIFKLLLTCKVCVVDIMWKKGGLQQVQSVLVFVTKMRENGAQAGAIPKQGNGEQSAYLAMTSRIQV